jgi:hypothetical protein
MHVRVCFKTRASGLQAKYSMKQACGKAVKAQRQVGVGSFFQRLTSLTSWNSMVFFSRILSCLLSGFYIRFSFHHDLRIV